MNDPYAAISMADPYASIDFNADAKKTKKKRN